MFWSGDGGRAHGNFNPNIARSAAKPLLSSPHASPHALFRGADGIGVDDRDADLGVVSPEVENFREADMSVPFR